VIVPLEYRHTCLCVCVCSHYCDVAVFAAVIVIFLCFVFQDSVSDHHDD